MSIAIRSQDTTRRPSRSRNRRPAWQENPSILHRVMVIGVLGLAVALVAIPLYAVVITSLADQASINEAGGLTLLPSGLTLDAYRNLLAGGVVTRATLVSIGVTAVGTVFSLAVTTLAAYGLSRPGSVGYRGLLMFVLATLFFGPGMIPSYLMVRGLGLIDTFAALILPNAVFAFHIIVMRSFFMGLPHELLESARIDGAGEFRILGRIVLPLSKAVIAVIALFYGVGYWNAFFNALIYLNDNAKWPLQLVLRTFVLQGAPLPNVELGSEGAQANAAAAAAAPQLAVRMAIVVLAMLPILFVFPFVQRHFTQGVIIGAVKG